MSYDWAYIYVYVWYIIRVLADFILNTSYIIHCNKQLIVLLICVVRDGSVQVFVGIKHFWKESCCWISWLYIGFCRWLLTCWKTTGAVDEAYFFCKICNECPSIFRIFVIELDFQSLTLTVMGGSAGNLEIGNLNFYIKRLNSLSCLKET